MRGDFALIISSIIARSAAFDLHVPSKTSLAQASSRYSMVHAARSASRFPARSRRGSLICRRHSDPWCAEPECAPYSPSLLRTASIALAAAIALSVSLYPVEAATSLAVTQGAASTQSIFEQAARRALGGGVSGALAGVAQVLLLMWLRTTMNYQYRNGGSTTEALEALYKEGGIPRFYRGVSFALFQTPLSRFGDTAANSGMLALLATSDLPMSVQTACASAVAAIWRMGLTPIDTMKTTLQVKGADGYDQVTAKIKAEGVPVLFQGALANAFASFIGNYPWYLTFNTLNEMLPAFGEELPSKLIRSALLGISAAGVSDCISNSVRVLKTTRQTSEATISYQEAAERILSRDGWRGLLGRGLGTRLATNALQAALFTVLWKLLEETLVNTP